MANQGKQDPGKGSKQPFVSKEDRPEVKISLDTPLNELRVRELGTILGFIVGKNPNFEVGKTPIKDFFDKPFPETVKDWIKELKPEKIEKPEFKELKHEKIEKPELKEHKHEKLEREPVFDPGTIGPGPDPRFDHIVQVVSGLTKQVALLANQLEELKKKLPG